MTSTAPSTQSEAKKRRARNYAARHGTRDVILWHCGKCSHSAEFVVTLAKGGRFVTAGVWLFECEKIRSKCLNRWLISGERDLPTTFKEHWSIKQPIMLRFYIKQYCRCKSQYVGKWPAWRRSVLSECFLASSLGMGRQCLGVVHSFTIRGRHPQPFPSNLRVSVQQHSALTLAQRISVDLSWKWIE